MRAWTDVFGNSWLEQDIELPILRPKVVAPMADAMRFVDRETSHVDLPQDRLKTVGHESLWRGEHQADIPERMASSFLLRWAAVRLLSI